jgi:hypothetical protein
MRNTEPEEGLVHAVAPRAVRAANRRADIEQGVVVFEVRRQERVSALLEDAMGAVDRRELVGVTLRGLFERRASLEALAVGREGLAGRGSKPEDLPGSLKRLRSLDPEGLLRRSLLGELRRGVPVAATQGIDRRGADRRLLKAKRVGGPESSCVMACAVVGEERFETVRERVGSL